jgi:hypothetical protein
MTMDIIKINVPAFIRLIELAREDVKNDADLHDMAEIVTRITKEDGLVTMDHYKDIVRYMKTQGTTDELDQIRKLGGF